MPGKYSSSSGNPYSAGCWLDNHHSIKNRLRAELIHRLPVPTGARVLDIGCGTGLWSLLLAERVGHKGRVVGVDGNQASIDIAIKRKSVHHLGNSIEFMCADVMDCDFDGEFDVVVMFNVLSYLNSPEVLLKNIRKYLCRNGVLLIKDSDIGSDFYWPIDTGLYCRLMTKIHQAGITTRDGYNHFFARNIPALLRSCSFVNQQVFSQSFSFCYPIDSCERRYISANAEMVRDCAAEAGDELGAEEWWEQFTETSSSCIYDRPEFLYSMTEFLFQARAPESS